MKLRYPFTNYTSLHSCKISRRPRGFVSSLVIADIRFSEMLPTVKIMKNYPRCFPVTEAMVQSWRSCSYIGETTRTHDEILELCESALDSNGL